jgi:hypothetical protein
MSRIDLPRVTHSFWFYLFLVFSWEWRVFVADLWPVIVTVRKLHVQNEARGYQQISGEEERKTKRSSIRQHVDIISLGCRILLVAIPLPVSIPA